MTYLTNYVSFLIAPTLNALSMSILFMKFPKNHQSLTQNGNASILKEKKKKTKMPHKNNVPSLFFLILITHNTPNRFIIHIITKKISLISQQLTACVDCS